MCSKKPCHTPEIVLDSTCDSLNLPLWVLQLHVSTRLRIWWRQISTLKKKRRENVLVFLKILTEYVCFCIYPWRGSAAFVLWSWRRRFCTSPAHQYLEEEKRREVTSWNQWNIRVITVHLLHMAWPKIKVEYISKSIQMLIHPLRNRPKKEDSWHHSKLPVN